MTITTIPEVRALLIEMGVNAFTEWKFNIREAGGRDLARDYEVQDARVEYEQTRFILARFMVETGEWPQHDDEVDALADAAIQSAYHESMTDTA